MKTNEQYEVPAGYKSVSVWGNYVLATRYSVGFAARKNRGSFSGQKIHRIVIKDIVKILDVAAEQALPTPTLGKRFLNAGKPYPFSSYPMCGCTNGQHAARECVGREVTCTKCGVPKN